MRTGSSLRDSVSNLAAYPALNNLRKKSSRAQEAHLRRRHISNDLTARVTRALPKPALIGVFPQVVKRCADTKPDFFRACEAVPFSPLAWPRVLRSEQALLEVRPLPREPPAICALQAVRGASLVRLRGLIRQRV